MLRNLWEIIIQLQIGLEIILISKPEHFKCTAFLYYKQIYSVLAWNSSPT